jgi:hypothetical protein
LHVVIREDWELSFEEWLRGGEPHLLRYDVMHDVM